MPSPTPFDQVCFSARAPVYIALNLWILPPQCWPSELPLPRVLAVNITYYISVASPFCPGPLRDADSPCVGSAGRPPPPRSLSWVACLGTTASDLIAQKHDPVSRNLHSSPAPTDANSCLLESLIPGGDERSCRVFETVAPEKSPGQMPILEHPVSPGNSSRVLTYFSCVVDNEISQKQMRVSRRHGVKHWL